MTRNPCVHSLFEEQSIQRGDATAVLHKDDRISYCALNQRANQLAKTLLDSGAGPETIVAICIEKSIDLIAAILGVLKSGSAYLPIDPTYPRERIDFLLNNSKVRLVLTQNQFANELKRDDNQTLAVDSLQLLGSEDVPNPSIDVQPENLAYVMYTSGSTGQPKGVMIEHRSLANFAKVALLQFEITERDRLLQFASTSWDTSIEEIFPALISGATLVLRTNAMLASFSSFLRECSRFGITLLNLPTAFWHELTTRLETEDASLLSSLRLLIIGGEKALPERLELWKKHVSNQVRIFNTYGCTEATAISCSCELLKTPDGAYVPIGKAIPSVETVVLDDSGRNVKVGDVGELYIGGAGLARGYFQQPELTASRFIPGGAINGSRLYKTGDLVRLRKDGNLEYIGRYDAQIKIRGHRVELGEIESALREYSGILDAAIIAREQSTGDKRLAGFIVVQNKNVKLSPDAIRNFLKARLPDFMIPSSFQIIDALPLSPNGKVDRNALKALSDHSQDDRMTNYVPPVNSMQSKLVSIWSDVLKIEPLGIRDNFFELGGNSLQGIQIVSRLREAFKTETSVQLLFENPTIEQLATRLQSLERIPEIAKLERAKGVAGRHPLSSSQQRLWFLDQLVAQKYLNNISDQFFMEGSLDIEALRASVNEIIRRHEILRTSFGEIQMEPTQIVLHSVNLEMPVIDLTDFSEPDLSTEIAKLSQDDIRLPFDLRHPPLIRLTLIKTAKQNHVLLLTMHHIISDDWSLGVFYRELSTLYNAYSAGKSSPLPELPLQYSDFANWQNQQLEMPGFQLHMEYWKNELKGAPSQLELPADHPRSTGTIFKGATDTFWINPDLASKLKELSRREGVTLFMTLMAAFNALLYRYTEQKDILVGTLLAGRTHVELEELFGLFTNTLVMRTKLSEDLTFADLLEQTRRKTLSAFEHQEMPFERLVAEIQPERLLSQFPLFQVMFILQNAPDFELELRGLKTRRKEVFSDAGVLDLAVEIKEKGDQLECLYEYDARLFKEETIFRMHEHFINLLNGIVSNPQNKISGLPLLTSAEEYQVLHQWSHSNTEPLVDRDVMEIFERQVEKTPDRMAAIFGSQRYTYKVLNERANRVAEQLRKEGVRANALVGLLTDRSMEMLIGILAIWKAGGAYLPLEPHYPEERLAFMLEDSGAAFLLSSKAAVDWIDVTKSDGVGKKLYLHQLPAKGSSFGQSGEDRLAYVIYTSGSTGKSKGVAVGHRALLNTLGSMQKRPGIDENDTLLAITTFCFDISILELILPLLTGASVVIASREEASDPAKMLAVIASNNVKILQATPATWQMLLDAGWRGSSLKKILCGGEALGVELASRLAETGAEIWNLYGPTEATIWCSTELISPPVSSISLGMPTTNTTLYILNEAMNPVPIGVYGELYIGGPSLANGYLNRPELTAQKFVPDRFGENQGDRLFKTGDKVRYRENGSLEFVGRNDFQVKIRGFRVELGELENTLLQHPSVRHVVVTAPKDQQGMSQLVAYIVSSEPAEQLQPLLRKLLRSKLPDYMIPSHFIFLNELPLTTSGKIDRHALPVPEAPVLTRSTIPPRTDVELRLAEIWKEVLHLENLGVDDNFFELGGHSLLATKVISRVRSSFHVELALRTIFESPTIAGLAAAIALEQAGEADPEQLMNMISDLDSLSDEEAKRLLN